MKMLLEFFPFAVVTGLAIALACSLVGVFVILKRVVFIGVVLSEVAAFGVAIGIVTGLSPFLGAAALTASTVALLSYPFEARRIPRDAVMGVVFVAASALSVLLVSQSAFGLEQVKALLYGDLLLASPTDSLIALSVAVPVIAALLVFLRPTVYAFLDPEGAKVLGVNVRLWELLFFFALGLVVAASSKVAGAILVFCYLVVAPAAALLLTRRLRVALALSAGAALFSTFIGMWLSFGLDLPANQTVSALACATFVAALGWSVIT